MCLIGLCDVNAHLVVLQSGQLLAVELVLDVLRLQGAQHGRHFGARAQILVQILQRSEVLLRAATADVRQLRVHLVDALAVELLAQNTELPLQIGCTTEESALDQFGFVRPFKAVRLYSPRLSMQSLRRRSHSLSSISDESSESGSSASSPLESRSGPAPPRLDPDRCDSAPDIMSSSPSLSAAAAAAAATDAAVDAVAPPEPPSAALVDVAVAVDATVAVLLVVVVVVLVEGIAGADWAGWGGWLIALMLGGVRVRCGAGLLRRGSTSEMERARANRMPRRPKKQHKNIVSFVRARYVRV